LTCLLGNFLATGKPAIHALPPAEDFPYKELTSQRHHLARMSISTS